MEAANIIRAAVQRVTKLRLSTADQPALARALAEVKQFQARRFAGTYFDLLQTDQYQGAARFFLDELYSTKDYSQRDAQFARIAVTLERIFPQSVVQTAVALAQLHCLSEELDLAMAQQWLENQEQGEVARYVRAWRLVASPAERQRQLTMVLEIGHELDRLVRAPGLRLMLRMMRQPAHIAGLGSLQGFLEAGFDTFANMARLGNGATWFLATVQTREAGLIERLFASETVACETEIGQALGQAR
jgi:hypothetical protein